MDDNRAKALSEARQKLTEMEFAWADATINSVHATEDPDRDPPTIRQGFAALRGLAAEQAQHDALEAQRKLIWDLEWGPQSAQRRAPGLRRSR